MVTTNRVTGNRITGNQITANRVAANRITATRITENRLTVNGSAAELLATPDGRELFSVLVSCAIPEGVTLVATVSGFELEFFGELGLARQWLHHPLDREGQGWVSACVFSKVNVRDVALSISLRGPHPALKVGKEERAKRTLEEGAFYGNMFTPLDQPIVWIACRGADQAVSERGELVDRDCAEEDPELPGLTQCGFTFAGDCANFFGEEAACEQFSEHGEFYKSCHAGPIDDEDHHGHGHHDRDGVFQEVITSYVTP